MIDIQRYRSASEHQQFIVNVVLQRRLAQKHRRLKFSTNDEPF